LRKEGFKKEQEILPQLPAEIRIIDSSYDPLNSKNYAKHDNQPATK